MNNKLILIQIFLRKRLHTTDRARLVYIRPLVSIVIFPKDAYGKKEDPGYRHGGAGG